MKRQYNLTKDDYNERVAELDGKCEVCGTTAKLHIDHCHKSEFVRGLLCFHCNTALGHFKDDPAIIANALKYLQRAGVELPADVWELWPIREPDKRKVRLFIKGYGDRQTKTTVCERCGGTFESLRAGTKYCSRKCQEVKNYDRWKERQVNASS